MSYVIKKSTNITAPVEDDVRDGVVYGEGGISETGNLVLPPQVDVLDGETYGADGIEYTGNLEMPVEADVKSTVQYGAGGTEYTGEYIGANVSFADTLWSTGTWTVQAGGSFSLSMYSWGGEPGFVFDKCVNTTLSYTFNTSASFTFTTSAVLETITLTYDSWGFANGAVSITGNTVSPTITLTDFSDSAAFHDFRYQSSAAITSITLTSCFASITVSSINLYFKNCGLTLVQAAYILDAIRTAVEASGTGSDISGMGPPPVLDISGNALVLSGDALTDYEWLTLETVPGIRDNSSWSITV
jgi:hypothetical protein